MKEFFDVLDKALLPMSWNDILQWVAISIVLLAQRLPR